MLVAYDQQCDEAAKIFAEYQRRLHHYVDQAQDAYRLTNGSITDVVDELHSPSEKEAVYSTVKGIRSLEDIVLVETPRERNVCKACVTLFAHMIERIQTTFPAYEGSGISMNSQIDVAKLGLDLDGEIPEDVKVIIEDTLKSPSLLLRSITTYAMWVSSLTEKQKKMILELVLNF